MLEKRDRKEQGAIPQKKRGRKDWWVKRSLPAISDLFQLRFCPDFQGEQSAKRGRNHIVVGEGKRRQKKACSQRKGNFEEKSCRQKNGRGILGRDRGKKKERGDRGHVSPEDLFPRTRNGGTWDRG